MKKETILWKDALGKYAEQNIEGSGGFPGVCNWLEQNGYKISITKKVR